MLKRLLYVLEKVLIGLVALAVSPIALLVFFILALLFIICALIGLILLTLTLPFFALESIVKFSYWLITGKTWGATIKERFPWLELNYYSLIPFAWFCNKMEKHIGMR